MKQKRRNFFYVLIGLAAFLTLAVLWDFLSIILVSMCFAVVLYPVFNWINLKITKKRAQLASLLTVSLFIVVVGGFLFFIGSKIISEAQSLNASLNEGNSIGNFLDTLSQKINTMFADKIGITFDIKREIGNLTNSLSQTVASIFSATLKAIFTTFLILISIFYFLKDGHIFREYTVSLSLLPKEQSNRILDALARSIDGIINGYLFIALLQGFLVGLGLWVFSVPNATLWGVIAGIGSLIPSVGTAVISVPAISYLLITGKTVPAIGLGFWTLGIVGWIDNVLHPFVIGQKIGLPAVVVLFSLLGGIALMGPAGILIGPLAAAFLHTLLIIYKESFQNEELPAGK